MKFSLGWVAVLFVILLFGVCSGVLVLPIELAIVLVFGWISFLWRTWPLVYFNWGDIALAATATVLFIVGLRFFLRSLWQTLPDRRWSFRRTLAITLTVLLAFAAGTSMVGIVHQVAWMATSKEPIIGGRETPRRMSSMNNQRNQTLAVLNYHSATTSLPAGCLRDEQGAASHGWITQILHSIGRPDLYNKINRDIPWTAPENVPHFQHELSIFINPGEPSVSVDPTMRLGMSHYASNAHVIGPGPALKLAEITDGASQTILSGEAKGNFKPWGHPANWRDPADGINKSANGFGGPWHGNQTIISFCDGSARIITDDIDPQLLKALSTPAGGEKVRERDQW